MRVQLEKWQRNAIFEAVKEGGLNPRECTFEYDNSRSRIMHVPSGAIFLLEGRAGTYNSTMVIGEAPPRPLRHYTWPTVEGRIQLWAAEVKRDVETPDLWAELQRERDLIGARHEDAENTPFTPDEQTEIAAWFRQAKEYIRDRYELSAEQYDAIEARLDQLEDASRRGVGRIDWRNQLVGVLLGLAIDAILPPEPVQQVVILVLRGLAQLFGGHGVPELPGPPPGLV